MARNANIVRVGVIGCGQVAQERHLPVLTQLPRARVVAAADVDRAQVARVASRFEIAACYEDHRALLDRDDVDAVAIMTPPQTHTEIGLAALDAGKHVFIEKPLALRVDECDQLIARAARSDRQAMVGFNLRWHRLVRRAREMIQRGALGEIIAIHSSMTAWYANAFGQGWLGKRAQGGGAIYHQAAHQFDLWHAFVTSPVAQIFATAESSADFEDETVSVNARMANGVLASGLFSLKTSGNNQVEIFGDAGRLRVALYQFDGLEFFPAAMYAGDIVARAQKTARGLLELPRVAPIIFRGGDFVASYRAEWKHFLDCIARNTRPECGLEDGKRAAAIAVAVVDSINTGKPIQMKDVQR